MKQLYNAMHMALVAFLMVGAAHPAMAESELVQGHAKPWQLGFQDAATPVMAKLSGLHDELLVIITIITILVLGLLAYVCVRYSRKNNPVSSKVTHNTMLEVIWTVIPICILAYIGVKSVPLHYYMDKSVEPDMTIKVTGYQWYWGYEYPEHDNLEFKAYIKKDEELGEGDLRLLSTDKPVVVPVGKKVRVLMTSSDVIHSWAIPAFGVKTDAVPGRLNETWFQADKTGIFYGQCSELCGVSHGFMPIEIRVVEQDVFNGWIANAKNEQFALNGLSLPAAQAVETAPAEAVPAVVPAEAAAPETTIE
jgi:cytochrome c oxidase subunit 2